LTSRSTKLARPFGEYLRGLYVDTVSYHAAALEGRYAAKGGSRILYGTDHPFGQPDQLAELIDTLSCSAYERELIYHGHLETLTDRAAPKPDGWRSREVVRRPEHRCNGERRRLITRRYRMVLCVRLGAKAAFPDFRTADRPSRPPSVGNFSRPEDIPVGSAP
jgi:hypothetical protein